MKLPHHTRTARHAFTLVELLVVIAIIGILIGLISAAVVRALQKGNEAANRAEIGKMDAAVQAFQTQYKVSYFPSRIKLCKYVAHYNTSNEFDRDSLAYLNQVWPRLGWITPTGAGGQLEHRRIDWDGTTGGGGDRLQPNQVPASNGTNTFVLDGGQCLVFFLGGIPVGGLPSRPGTPGTNGFATNPLNPTTGTERVSPFYEFKSNRLWPPEPPPTDTFYFYRDVYGSRAYTYFSSYGKRNSYNKFGAAAGSDCFKAAAYGGTVVWPLAEQPGRYLNPDSFQIISAGANEAFGPGTVLPAGTILWSYRNPGAAYSGTTPGSDDVANFHDRLLGVPAE